MKNPELKPLCNIERNRSFLSHIHFHVVGVYCVAHPRFKRFFLLCDKIAQIPLDKAKRRLSSS